MQIALRTSFVLAATVLFGCGDSPASEPAAGSPASREPRSRAVSSGPADAQADLEELADYELNMDDLQKFTVAQLNMLRAAQGMPDVDDASGDESDTGDDTAGDGNSLGGMEARIESVPALRKAVEDAGLDAREYSTIALTYMTSAMAAGLVKMGTPLDSVATQMKVNPDNVTWILDNETKIAPLMERMQAEAKRLEGGA